MLDKIEVAYHKVLEEQTEKVKQTLIRNKIKHYKECTEICKHLNSNRNTQFAICDIGGGVGINLLVLRQLFPNARLDIIDRYDEYEEKHDNQMGTFTSAKDILNQYNISFKKQNILKDLPYDSGTYDIVTCFDVIEHIPGSCKLILDEAHRILKPRGLLLVTCPNIVNLRNRIEFLFGKSSHTPIKKWYETPSREYFDHFREYTADEVKYMLETSGFNDVKVELYSPYIETFVKYGIPHKIKEINYLTQKTIYYTTAHIYYYFCLIYPNFRSTILANGIK